MAEEHIPQMYDLICVKRCKPIHTHTSKPDVLWTPPSPSQRHLSNLQGGKSFGSPGPFFWEPSTGVQIPAAHHSHLAIGHHPGLRKAWQISLYTGCYSSLGPSGWHTRQWGLFGVF